MEIDNLPLFGVMRGVGEFIMKRNVLGGEKEEEEEVDEKWQ